MKKTFALALLGLLLIIAVIAGIKFLQIKTLIQLGETMVEPPVSISTTAVESDEWGATLTAIGSLEAAKGLLLTADLSGRITQIHFSAGSNVSAGDLIIEQDISTEKAQLRAANSESSLAKSNFERIKQLYRRKVASKSEYDSASSAYYSALAEVDNIRAAIEKKSIRAPFNGRLGIRLVNLGQSIDAGEPVVSLQASDEMFVNFFLPQQHFSQLSTGLKVRLTSDAVPGKTFEGKINVINPVIEATTRSVEVQALLDNSERQLLPGMFANIEVVLPDVQSVLIIPITAVQYATYGDSVFVIEAGDPQKKSEGDKINSQDLAAQSLVARQQFVRLGATRGDYVVVEKGLKKGELVANAGVFKLRNGVSVSINNRVVPEFSVQPSLTDQ